MPRSRRSRPPSDAPRTTQCSRCSARGWCAPGSRFNVVLSSDRRVSVPRGRPDHLRQPGRSPSRSGASFLDRSSPPPRWPASAVIVAAGLATRSRRRGERGMRAGSRDAAELNPNWRDLGAVDGDVLVTRCTSRERVWGWNRTSNRADAVGEGDRDTVAPARKPVDHSGQRFAPPAIRARSWAFTNRRLLRTGPRCC